ncbi:MAG: D-sedoheptulose 7-phosphate isomerase [Raineya sp.]|nr:D-sedoheptulose 7-phosphate isomerase [Raineya sp.]MDW8295283.1 D-sedoheptulose 7-phosphate isomerase [Raineya sp.]
MLDFIINEWQEAQKVLVNFFQDEKNLQGIAQTAKLMIQAIQQGKKIIACGNGGSHCDAMHFAEELSGKYRENRPALPALAISDSGHITCVSNDYGFEYVYARFLEALGQEGDVLVAISTSGNSPNVLKAVEFAKQKGLLTIALTGKDGGKLTTLADYALCVPHFGYADRIQEIHIKIIHIWIGLIEQEIFGKK